MSANAKEARIDASGLSRDAIAKAFAAIAVAAGPVIMSEYGGDSEVRAKADSSPVTIADERAEALILALLRTEALGLPVVAEESVSRGGDAAVGDRFILVDPLDGTREFISRNGEFTVNIALVSDGAPIAGAVYAPALARLWWAGERAYQCEAPVGAPLPAEAAWQSIRTRRAPSGGLVALASRSHADPATEAFLAKLPIGERRSTGSSLKFCAIAAGAADVYPRFAPTMEWDTAAGDAVLRAAGGVVVAIDGGLLRYGKTRNGLRNGGFVAWGDPTRAAQTHA